MELWGDKASKERLPGRQDRVYGIAEEWKPGGIPVLALLLALLFSSFRCVLLFARGVQAMAWWVDGEGRAILN